ncbi:MAG: phenylacetate--CoA ligase family protein [Candidatus Nealsonbacteria bacterium]|nr:phenylacetate--CoA ligase family protein [Candidatus Nealsonbacteria bacterium]
MPSNFSFYLPQKKIEKVLRDLQTKKAAVWEKKGERMALELFRLMARDVPAYQRLLKKLGIRPESIKKIKDFNRLPVVDKASYIKTNDFADLFPKKNIGDVTTFSATSGSTGEPTFFPRGEKQDQYYEYILEIFLRNQFEIHRKKTLGIIGFGLGVWIGGIFTYKNLNQLAQKGYSLSLVPVGPNKELVLKSLQKFGRLFDQVILMGYPPFIKDVIDEAPAKGINWRDYKIRILTAAEGFSEEFREYLAEKTGLKNPLTDVVNIYGTVELGTMAHETALGNLIRKIAWSDPAVFQEVFGCPPNRIPTLAQYHPYIVYFEEVKEEVIGTGFCSGIPLIRYRFPDKGGVIPFEKMVQKLKNCEVDIFQEARKAQIEKTILRLPFVYVYERSDSAATLVGIIIYPEYIKAALEKKPFERYLTGKFTMITKTDEYQNQFLEINVELKRGVKGSLSLARQIEKESRQTLASRSTEYNHLLGVGSEKEKERLRPRIVLWPAEHPVHFRPGAKQSWVKKPN